MTTRRLLIGALLVAVIAVTYAVSRGDSEGEAFHEDLSEAVQRRVSGATGLPIELSALTAFDWDHVWFFDGYTSADQIRRRLGADWDGAPSSSRGFETTVVFTKDSEPVRGYTVGAFPGVGTCLEVLLPLPVKNARLVVARVKRAPQYRYLVAEAIVSGEARAPANTCAEDVTRPR